MAFKQLHQRGQSLVGVGAFTRPALDWYRSTPRGPVECIEENMILRRICPGSFEENDGLFVALTDEDMDEPPKKLAAEARAAGLAEDEFFVLRHGETRALGPSSTAAR